jgi:hypothetical protein
MQRKTLFAVVLLGLALCPIPAYATAVCAAEGFAWLDALEAIVGPPGPQDVPPLDFAALGRGTADDQAPATGRRNLTSTCTANCGSSTVSCTISGTCTAVDRNCPATPGYVVCGATTTNCPACACTNGAKRYTQLNSCCYNEAVGQCRKVLREETCVNGNWVTAYTCNGLNCPGTCPR